MVLEGLNLEQNEKKEFRFPFCFPVHAKKKETDLVNETSDFIVRVVFDSPVQFRG